ncbi:MAG: hypothetical protein LBS36_04445 [Oscillospiraceae bacterium]|jgi:hypothetical protein|nr:hypothetical protein [Oscillospiraceae bacterium]
MNITELLREKQSTSEVLSVFHDEQASSPAYSGMLAAADGECALFYCVSPAGKYDGYILDFIKNIANIRSGTRYESGRARLFRHYKQAHMPVAAEEDIKTCFFAFIQKHRFTVNVTLQDPKQNGLIAFWEAYDAGNRTLKFTLLNEYGDISGEASVSLADIKQISSERETERTARNLHLLG